MKATKSVIGLNHKATKSISAQLNKLLANYQIFYMNVRGYHWNITGPEFFSLHAKYEELYNMLQESVDEIAERILTLGAKPNHGYSQYAKDSKIREHLNATTAKETIGGIISGLETLIHMQREILLEVNEAEDEGTSSMLSDYIKAQEKLIWQYTAFLA